MIKLDFFKVGSCCNPSWVVTPGTGWKHVTFPALSVLIRHPTHGAFLFDTGYAARFQAATNPFPERFYRWITPIQYGPTDDLVAQLEKINITVNDIQGIFISHFHADHIAALIDFPKAKYMALKEAYDGIEKLKGLAAVRRGFIPSFLPSDFKNRYLAIDEFKPMSHLPAHAQPFEWGYDFFGDNSVWVIPLPGHARGQLGLWINETDQNKSTFLVADACWSSDAYRHNIRPSWISFLLHDNRKAYLQTLEQLHSLHQLNKRVQILPSHCNEVIQTLVHSTTSPFIL